LGTAKDTKDTKKKQARKGAVRATVSRSAEECHDMTDKPHEKWWNSVVCRNATVGLAALLAFCVIDLVCVTYEPSPSPWLELPAIMVYWAAFMVVNRNLYQGELPGAIRLGAALCTGILIAWAMLFVLALPAILFHGSIGGQL
jgi:hypothetical protein